MSLILNGTSQAAYTDTQPLAIKPVTICGWFKSTSSTANQGIVSVMQISNPEYLFATIRGATAGDPCGALEYHTSWRVAESLSGYSTGTWHHIAVTFVSATERSVWIDGGSKITNTDSEDVTFGLLDRIYVGAQNAGAGFFVGKLAEIGIWSSELSDANIASLAAGILPSEIDSSNLETYWKLLDDYLDSSGNNNTLTGVDTPTFDDTDHPSAGYEEGTKTVIGVGVVSLTSDVVVQLEGTKTVTGATVVSLSTESYVSQQGYPTSRVSDYDPDGWWDEVTGVWVSTYVAGPGSWTEYVVVISEEGEIYFRTV